eukprot:scaffold21682_cov24-Prasinocladus_malaysianus.AAC.1
MTAFCRPSQGFWSSRSITTRTFTRMSSVEQIEEYETNGTWIECTSRPRKYEYNLEPVFIHTAGYSYQLTSCTRTSMPIPVRYSYLPGYDDQSTIF